MSTNSISKPIAKALVSFLSLPGLSGLSGLSRLSGLPGLSGLSRLSRLSGLSGLSRLSRLSRLLCLWCLSFSVALALCQTSTFAQSRHTASHDGCIDWKALFHDQSELFDDNPEPEVNSTVTLKIRAAKNDLTGAAIKIEEANTQTPKLVEMALEKPASSEIYDYWQGTVPAGSGKSSYRFCLRDGETISWYNALGAAASESETSDFTLIPGFKTPGWLKNGVIYQIFVDRFFNGDPHNDVKTDEYTYAGKPSIQRSWGQSPLAGPNESVSMIFYGGDLSGVISKLHYVTDTVGADIVYLNPIFTAPSNHKYDTSDYDTIDKHFGDAGTLQKLSAELHSLPSHGRLLLDGVFNHTGDSHFWFNKFGAPGQSPGAYQAISSPYKNFYTFSNWPKEYATFLDVKELPKLNYNSSTLRSRIYLAPDSVAQKYLRAPFNIDGWRLDAPQYADGGMAQGSDNENHIIWEEFREAVKLCSPDSAILGEFWGDASPWTSRGEWDSVTNFEGFTKPASEWINGKTYSGEKSTMTVSGFDNWLRATRSHYPGNVQQCLSNHLSNHDIPRFAERAGGDLSKVSLALYFQLTYPGAPTIYYGDEYGMSGAADPDDRRCFDWTKATLDNELVSLTHKLIGLRKRYSALRTGSFMTLKCDDTDNVYCYGRSDQHDKIAVVLNNDIREHDVVVPISQLDATTDRFRDALSERTYNCTNGSITLRVPARQGLILVNEPGTGSRR